MAMGTLDRLSIGQTGVTGIGFASLPDFAPNCSWSNADSATDTNDPHALTWWNNTVYKLLFFGALIAIYKTVMNRISMQQFIHSFGKPDNPPYIRALCWLLQWYSLFAIVFIGLFVTNTYDIIVITWVGGKESIAQQLIDMKKDDLFWEMAMYVSWGGPMIAANLGLVLSLYHAVKFTRDGAHKRIRNQHPFPWQSTQIGEMVAVTVTLPLMTILMASKSTIRMWLRLAPSVANDACYDEVWYTINLQVVSIYGYMVIFVFTDLISSILKARISENVRFAVKMTSYQGTWAFVIVGVVQGLLEVVYAYAILNKENMGGDSNLAAIMQARSQLKTIATVFMILCIYNMIILCKVPLVKDALGNASLKFLATRAILLIIQYQPVILAFLSEPRAFVNTFQSDKLDDLEKKEGVEAIMSALDGFKEVFGRTPQEREATTRLYNVCFLCWEGLFMIIFNLYAWEKDPEELIRTSAEFGIDEAKPSIADKLLRSMSRHDEHEGRQKSLKRHGTDPAGLTAPML